LSANPQVDEILELMRTVVGYRMSEVRPRLEKIGRATSMLHVDVLMLIYHFAKIARGGILEIGAYIGGSSIAAALGARDSGTAKKIITVEPGGQLKHHRLGSRNIFKDLQRNLVRHKVEDAVTTINGYSFEPTTIATIRQQFGPGQVGLFVFDADANVRRDLEAFGNLLVDECWVVIDDYVGTTEKAAPTREAVDEFVTAGKLVPLGCYGWSTWVGRWRSLG
jgi:predicted O-methyltransferase YrrM